MLFFIPKASSLIFLGALLLVTSCATSPTGDSTSNSPAAPAERVERDRLEDGTTAAEPTDEPPLGSPEQAATANKAQAGAVDIYLVDELCEDFIPQSVDLSDTNSLDAVIGKVINLQDSQAFSISAYRVDYSPEDRQAVIDFRLSSDTDRSFESLSSCEQQALFGSLRETLMRSSTWSIETVRFTHAGQEILL
ncbi:MAG: hypothetical protein AAGF24_14675 [Cyanobacteria bacterium P01_H01_bin.121]